MRSVRAEYHFDDARWTQTFLSRELSDEDLAGHLAAAGLAVDRTLTDDGTWLLALPGALTGQVLGSRVSARSCSCATGRCPAPSHR